MTSLRHSRKGFLLGKFMPPHAGHIFLSEFAKAYCDELTVLLCSLPGDPIPGALRFQWMQSLLPGARVIWCQEPLPQAPEEHPDFWPIWREVVLRLAGSPDAVFASEAYGARLAEELGARFIPVDPGREAFPVSGTAIRANPYAHWRHLPAPVRAHYVKRVSLFGPESTGKTRSAQALAQRFDTIALPEYGRIHTDVFGVDVVEDDLISIAKGHAASVVAARKWANKLLIEDADPVMTAVWAEVLLGRRVEALDECADPADLYLLCNTDVPWIDDGTRYFPEPADRERFMSACKAELVRRGLRYVTISGADWADRQEQAIDAVLAAFPEVVS